MDAPEIRHQLFLFILMVTSFSVHAFILWGFFQKSVNYFCGNVKDTKIRIAEDWLLH